MDYLSAAVEVLRRSGRPMSATEITSEALRLGLIETTGQTPDRTMSARLYVAARDDPECPVRRQFQAGPTRAARGSVRWTLREQ